MDHQGRICLFNQAAEAVTGYSAEEALGQDVFELLIPPECKAELHAHYFASLKSGHFGVNGN